jgi:type IV secretion system protein VirB1
MITLAMMFAACGMQGEQVALLSAVVRAESLGNPNAINVNGAVELSREPRSQEDAAAIAHWLLEHGYNFDAGLGQVNSSNFARLGIDAKSAFEPCTNLRAAQQVLRECYGRAALAVGEGARAIDAALSCYNTGNFTRGLQNGYVRSVRALLDGASPARSAPAAAQGELAQSAEVFSVRMPDAFGARAAKEVGPTNKTERTR